MNKQGRIREYSGRVRRGLDEIKKLEGAEEEISA